MTFDEITISNFSVFRGTHTIALAPPENSRPIILVGGLNGNGKTSLMDAIQLVLFGKMADCSNRNSLPYDEFLKRSINRSASPPIASLELTFRHVSGGNENTYRILRSWTPKNGSVKEQLEVFCNEKKDAFLAERWNERVEEFIPSRISHLFFFDGEKVEHYADYRNSVQLLSTGLRSLLGLDVVDQLISDLRVLGKKKRALLRGEEDRTRLAKLREEVTSVYQEYDALHLQCAGVRNRVERSSAKLKKLEDEYRQKGGHLVQEREVIEGQLAVTKAELATFEEELRNVASGAAPLLLVNGLLSQVDSQLKKEEASYKAEALNGLVTEIEELVLSSLKAQRVPVKAFRQVAFSLEQYKKQRTANAIHECYLRIDSETNELLHGLPRTLSEIRDDLQTKLDTHEELLVRLHTLELKLEEIPRPESLQSLIEERQQAQEEFDQASRELTLIEEKLAAMHRHKDQKRSELINAIEMEIDSKHKDADAERIIHHSSRVVETMTGFRSEILKRNVARIEQLILESFHCLLRKSSLISRLQIDPEHMSLALFGGDGLSLSPERLSAGERQLLAISMLWGLAKASWRRLPVIIDTPLGRLDSAHRDTMVDQYFPSASHQVLLLSTDEEIDESLYQKLEPFVGRSYRLEYDDNSASTRVEEGYYFGSSSGQV